MTDDNDKPTFGELRDALMPPGSDKEALWAALKQAHRTGGLLPGRTAPDISAPPSDVPLAVRKALPSQSAMPADPFGQADSAGIALGEMYQSMLAGGIPLDSVERIIGHMLASLPAPGDGNSRPGA